MTSVDITDQPSDLTISIQLRPKDVRWAMFLYCLTAPRLAFYAVLVCGSLYSGNPRLAYFAVAAVLFVLVLLPWIQAGAAMRNPMMRSPIYHTFSASGISSKFQGGSLGLEWPLLRKARETRHYISIWGKRGTPMIVPKNQLNEVELASLRSNLRFYMQARASLNESN